MLLARTIFEGHVKSGLSGKAVASFVFLKNSLRNGCLWHFTYAKMSMFIGCSIPVCRKHVAYLIAHGFAYFEETKSGHRNLRLTRRYDRIWQRNIGLNALYGYYYNRFTGVRHGSAKDLYYLLMGLTVTECQNRKDSVKYLISAKSNPTSLAQHRNAVRKCRRLGISDGTEFSDGGTSYQYLQSQLQCSPYLVAKIIRTGDGVLFHKTRHRICLDRHQFPVGQFHAIAEAYEADGMPGKLYCTRKNIYANLANTYQNVQNLP